MMSYESFVNSVRFSGKIYANYDAIMARLADPIVSKAWHQGLVSEGISGEEYLKALQTMHTKQSFFPEPAAVIEHLRGSKRTITLESVAHMSAQIIIRLIGEIGYFEGKVARLLMGEENWKVVMHMGGWENLCAREGEVSFLERDIAHAAKLIYSGIPLDKAIEDLRQISTQPCHMSAGMKALEAKNKCESLESAKHMAIEGKVETPKKRNILADIIAQLKAKTAPAT